MSNDHEARLADLERRVSLLEGGSPDARPEDVGTAGSIGYTGSITLNGNVRWNIEYDAAATLAFDPATVTAVLDALGNPARLAIVRTLLRGPATAAELQEATELSSTGKLYHHLRALSAARVVAQESRNRYRIAPEKAVPLLVLTLAAADVGELL